jgi:hypothetical protein
VVLRAHGADSSAGCLLGHSDAGFRLAADLMPALDELPDAVVDLDARLQREQGPMRVLTGWGPTIGPDGTLVLATFTALAPGALRSPVVALLLTDEGTYLRYGSTRASDADGPLPAQAAVARLLAAPGNRGATLYVAAEAAVSLAELVALLRLLPAEHEVVLGLPLPAGTRLPSVAAAAQPDLCPEGLPTPGEQSVEGALEPRAIVAALAPLRSDAQACLDRARGQARAGGRLVLALRIGEDGRAQAACLAEDGIGDPALGSCVLSSARALRFPAPEPAGFVDVRLPLALSPAESPPQRALCD